MTTVRNSMAYMAIFGILFASKIVYSQPVSIVTSSYPPYNHLDEFGEVTGMGTEVVEAILDELDLDTRIELLPFGRAFQMATDNENTLIYTIGKNKEREEILSYVGKITPEVKRCFYALASRDDIVVNTLSDAKKYHIGTVIEGSVEKYLLGNGFKLKKSIHPNTSLEANLKKLLADRIDLWAVMEFTAPYLARKNGLEPNDSLKQVYCIDDKIPNAGYLAFSKKTQHSLVEKFKQALAEIKANGVHRNIIASYR